MAYTFSNNRIDDHQEKLGFDVRPIIEVRMERDRLWSFGQYLMDTFPQLFENLVTGGSEFQARKKLIFPGKGEADVLTLVLTARGPVFIFPRTLGQVSEETDLPEANELIRDCLRKFLEVFPDRSIVRAGKVNEYIFGCDDIPAKQVIAERFLSISESTCKDVLLKLNLATEEFNRSIQLQALTGIRRRQIAQELVQEQINGISVHVDFNNQDISQSLSHERISSILRQADEFNARDLYSFLNRDD